MNKCIFRCVYLFGIVVGCNAFAIDPPQLCNYVGTGGTELVLGSNCPKWSTFSINYQNCGNIPFANSAPQGNCSSWDIKGGPGFSTYYGHVEIVFSGQTPQIKSWQSGDPTQPYNGEITGVALKQSNNQWGITIQTIAPNPNKPLVPLPNISSTKPADFCLATKNALVIGTDCSDLTTPLPGFENIKMAGYSRDGLQWSGPHAPDGNMTDYGNFKYFPTVTIPTMKKWGANIVRIPLNAEAWFESASNETEGSYRQTINAIVSIATQQKMLVILDLHWPTYAQEQTPMVPKKITLSSTGQTESTINFWNQVAYTYKDFGNVLFELYNEPVNINNETWLNGNDQYFGYQDLYDAVRAQGANNVVIVNGLSYGFDLSFVNENKLNCTNGSGESANCFVKSKKGSADLAANIIYGSHPYNGNGDSSEALDANFEGIKGMYPLICTEFGSNQQSAFPPSSQYLEYYQPKLDYFNDNNVHYIGFTWYPGSSWMPSMIKGSIESPQPQFAGTLLKNNMLDNPDTLFEWSTTVLSSSKRHR